MCRGYLRCWVVARAVGRWQPRLERLRHRCPSAVQAGSSASLGSLASTTTLHSLWQALPQVRAARWKGCRRRRRDE